MSKDAIIVDQTVSAGGTIKEDRYFTAAVARLHLKVALFSAPYSAPRASFTSANEASVIGSV
ncbi:MAG: hypothetical protein ACTHXM_12360, partial [Halomonas sp.]